MDSCFGIFKVVAYLDAGTGSMLVVLALAGALFGLGGWILNIFGLIGASRLGSRGTTRVVFHAIGIVLTPLGSILGIIWLFSWRKSDKFAIGILPD